MEGLRKEMVGSAVTQILLPARNDWDPEIRGAKRLFLVIEDRKPLSGAKKALPQALEIHVRHPLTCSRWGDIQGLDLRGQRPVVSKGCYKCLF